MNSIQPNYRSECYEDEYQSAEDEELERETTFQKNLICNDILEYDTPIDELCSYIKYSMATGDESVCNDLDELFINAVSCNFQPDNALNRILEGVINSTAEKLAKKALK
jgi:hypothetical protein